ncbi:unnamed protein product, partial [Trichobilharzia regenti]
VRDDNYRSSQSRYTSSHVSDNLVSKASNEHSNLVESTFLNASSGEVNSFELIDAEDTQYIVWQPDCIAHQCTQCRIEFSAIRPKHHCR